MKRFAPMLAAASSSSLKGGWVLALWVAAAACAQSGPGSPVAQDPGGADAGSPGGADASPTTDAAPPVDAGSEPNRSVAEELGLTQYAGRITPELHDQAGGVTTYTFDPAQGPLCMRGGEYYTSVRDAGADDLVVYLQFGGVCWSGFCLATNRAQPGIPDVEIMNPDNADNPVAGWNHVFAPYCDGSLFAGDAEHDDNLNGRGKRFHHGLANLTAALEVAKLRFPDPRRVLLAGSSGGSYGLLVAGFLTRFYYPDAELILLADSGIGLARGADPSYLGGLLDEFNLRRFLPADCPDCAADGHLTGLLGYLLARDPAVRVGMFSSWYDSTLAKLYLDIPSQEFADALQQQSDRLHAAHPARFRRFVVDGVKHALLVGETAGVLGTDWNSTEVPPDAWIKVLTTVQLGSMYAAQIDGLTAAAWLRALIDDDPAMWTDRLAARGPVPQ